MSSPLVKEGMELVGIVRGSRALSGRPLTLFTAHELLINVGEGEGDHLELYFLAK